MTIPQKTVERMGRGSAPRIVVTYLAPVMTELDSSDQISDTTYTLEVSETIGNTTATSTSFSDVPLTEQGVSVLEITPSIDELDVLEVDIENDGVTDFEVRPNEVFEQNQGVLIQRDSVRTLSRSGGRVRAVLAMTTTSVEVNVIVPDQAVMSRATTTHSVLLTSTSTATATSVITLNKTASVFGAIGEGTTRHFLYGVMSRIKNFMKMVMIRLSA
jgi:hypothetical protein